MDEDLVVAMRLQEEWDMLAAQREAARDSLSLVDASWELVDPTPDLQALFLQFNDQFFGGKLEAVEVKWSVRMTLCAGICTYEGRGGMCSIRLSEPLLKLRPRKDLVETLLHEMIHAYLFVTNNDKDREGHGPEFCKHMYRINHLTGANITVYHTFYDEVDEYRRHWWRCDGPCQHKQPYYGYVKRATNRAPSAHDYWWAAHQKTCGGTYIKIKEPENYSKKGRGKTKSGKQPVSAVEDKDKLCRGETQPLIPFSGKGYILGETRTPSGKLTSHAVNEVQGLSSKDHSTNGLRLDSSIEGKCEQNGFSSKKPHLVFPISTGSHQSVLSSYFPKVSVANQKAFRSVNGSPVKSGTTGDGTKHSPSSGFQRKVPPSRTSMKNTSKATVSASATVSSVKVVSSIRSQEVDGSEDQFPNKRSRLEDRTALDNIIKEQTPSSGSNLQNSSHPLATSIAQSSSSSHGHRRLVTCPVCHIMVLESQINNHLDWCLEGNRPNLRSRRV